MKQITLTTLALALTTATLFAQEATTDEKAQDWANQLKWMPVAKLMVTYSF